MIKVKEYLDKNFYKLEESTAELKKDGHYCVFGSWEYPKGIRASESERFKKEISFSNWIPKYQMSFFINN